MPEHSLPGRAQLPATRPDTFNLRQTLKIPGLRRPRAGAERPLEATARLRSLGLALGLAVLTVLVFAPVVGHDFVSLDDPAYVTANRQVRRGLTAEGFGWAWGAEVAANWHPLTWLSHMLDCELFGLDPGGHHLTSLLLHAANAVLLFVVLRRLTGAAGRSAVVAALFAVHPLHVESVAWIAERKDVLSGFFFLLTLARLRSAACAGPTPRRYLLAAPRLRARACWRSRCSSPCRSSCSCSTSGRSSGCRAARRRRSSGARSAGCAREAAVPRRCRWPRASSRSSPSAGRWSPLDALPLAQRARQRAARLRRLPRQDALAARPRRLLPAPPAQSGLARGAGGGALLAALTAVALARSRRSPWLAVGWLWFARHAGAGDRPRAGRARRRMADRYTYLPSIGLFVAPGLGGARSCWRGRRLRRRGARRRRRCSPSPRSPSPRARRSPPGATA